MYIVTFYCSTAKKNCSDYPRFLVGDATATGCYAASLKETINPEVPSFICIVCNE